jgi:hypothetical protein
MRHTMRLSMTQHESFHVNFYKPREGNLDGFSCLESPKTLKEDSKVFLFSISLVGSKNG